jgi:hypothetical protein
MAPNGGNTLDWTRLSLFLPVNDAEERLAFDAVAAYVRQNYQGLTHSVTQPYTFMGWWWDGSNGVWVEDRIAWLLIDVPITLSDPTLDLQIRVLQLTAKDAYQQQQRIQSEIWIIAHSISIYQ